MTSPAESKRSEPSWIHGARTPQTMSNVRSAYVILMLALVTMLAVADRNIIAVLLQSIQRDIGASDTAMGLLSGAAFSVAYAIAGIPLARLIDLGNRRNIMAVAVAVWSAVMALGGLATTYLHLFLNRTGVALAEGAVTPGQLSMIGDLYSPARRGTAVAAAMMGGALGVSVGSAVAGAVAEAFHWQFAFVVLGVPGLLIALLFWLTVPEPVRGAKDGVATHSAKTSTLKAVRYILSVPTLWLLILSTMLLYVAQSGWHAWMPTFFMRVHGMSLGSMSAMFGLTVGAGSLLSMLVAGLISDWLAKRGERWRSYFVFGALALGTPFVALATLAENSWFAWAMVFAFTVITGGVQPSLWTACLGIVRPDMRGLMSSTKLLVVQVIGAGGGPILIGALSDSMTRQFGAEGLRYSLLCAPVLFALAAIAALCAAGTADRDAKRVAEGR